jgi:hypothetical protein
MSSPTVIKKGTIYKLSTLGNNGFYYPEEEHTHRLDEDLTGTQMAWLKFNGLTAFLVESVNIKIRDFSTKNTVIWLDV